MSTMEKSLKLNSPRIGVAGELRIRSELILHGFTPAICDFDDGVDIILADNGNRIQVKTSTRPWYDSKNYSYRYSFAIRAPQFRNIGDNTFKKKFTKKNYNDVADYFVFWCIEHNIFYIIPVGEIGEKVSFCIPTPTEDRTYRINERTSKSKYEKYKDAWHLLA